jgi:single-stranded-DNA-specific exonuclease
MKEERKLQSKYERWEILSEGSQNVVGKRNKRGSVPDTKRRYSHEEDVVDILLRNRKIISAKDKKEYFQPIVPQSLKIKDLGINKSALNKSIVRIVKALKNKEKVIVFGDYDVDGISSSAILWKFLYSLGMDVTPYIPERFSEGYGVKIESIHTLKEKYPKLSLIITVDNGIVAHEAVKAANGLKIDVIIIDHHEKGEKYPLAYSIVHTTKLCGAAMSWIVVREIFKTLKKIGAANVPALDPEDTLEFSALGTVADQISLVGVNRSFVKYGLEKLNNTKGVGLNALYNASGIKRGGIGVYEINYIIAPRLNAMGRLEHAIDSLRLLCTKDRYKAANLAKHLNETNSKRQKIVDEVLTKAQAVMRGKKLGKIIVLNDESYHEGVIGLAASKLVDEFWRPAVVISRGKDISKGSARSIPGFNIIRAIESASKMLLGFGGHEMAAGFSLETKNISKFRKKLESYALKRVSVDILNKKLKVDLELGFENLSHSLMKKIESMEPFGIGNFQPTFVTRDCEIADVRKVGMTGNHLKFKLRKNNIFFDGILFNSINDILNFSPGKNVDIVYSLEKNVWNGSVSLQLKIKDLKYSYGHQ